MASKKLSELIIEDTLSISEAITILKAIQREAKKATQALRELEVAINDAE